MNQLEYNQYMRNYFHANREKINAAQKRQRLKRKYGLTEEQYFQMLEDQKGGCAICGKMPKKYRLSVDHCHTTGKVRGLLCSPCNRALGILGDNYETVSRAITYLLKHQVI